MVRTERIAGRHDAAALAYLSRAPYENVFLTYVLLFDSGLATRACLHVAFDENDAVTGVAYFGRQIVLAADNDETIEAFARVSRGYHGERMIVGPRAATARFWQFVESYHPAPRAVRERQYVMKIERPALRTFGDSVVARRARIDEWPAVADNSAAMIAQELDYDPRRSSPEFTANVRAMIERGLWWVGESYGRLCFFCNIGPWSPQTAQLQGIWTPPELRGKGLARAALSAVCDRLLTMSPTLSLYVNDFNERAVKLYDAVGFTTVAEFQTLLF